MKMNVTLLAGLLQSLLTSKAEELAQTTGLVQRQRKLTGAQWVQTLVFGWMEQPEASLEDLCNWLAEHHQVTISPQGLDGWFCPAGAACLQHLAESYLCCLAGTFTRICARRKRCGAKRRRTTGGPRCCNPGAGYLMNFSPGLKTRT